jgi:uncharacterized membrane protein YuzA (DUF378 family)
MTDIGLRLIGGLFAATFVITLLRLIIRPPARLSSRVRPYSAAGRSALGKNPDNAMLNGHEVVQAQGVLERLYRPIVESLLKSLTKTFGGAFDDEALSLKLRQSGVLSEVAEEERVHEFRVRQIASGLGFSLAGGLVTTVIGSSPALILAVALVAGISGVARISAGISSRIEDRRERMRSTPSTSSWRSIYAQVALRFSPPNDSYVEDEARSSTSSMKPSASMPEACRPAEPLVVWQRPLQSHLRPAPTNY